jgi:hypothetical protein
MNVIGFVGSPSHLIEKLIYMQGRNNPQVYIFYEQLLFLITGKREVIYWQNL